VYSYGPPRNYADHVVWLHLENNLEPSSAERRTDQLVTVAILLISSNLEIRKEALDGFVEPDSMLEKLIAFEIVLEVRRREPTPVNHTLFYAASAKEGGA
jgi:hypothetical protein